MYTHNSAFTLTLVKDCVHSYTSCKQIKLYFRVRVARQDGRNRNVWQFAAFIDLKRHEQPAGSPARADADSRPRDGDVSRNFRLSL